MNVPRNNVSAARILLTLAGASLALAAACSSSDDVTCGEGTVKRGNACVVATAVDGGGGDGAVSDAGSRDATVDSTRPKTCADFGQRGQEMSEITTPNGTRFCMDRKLVTFEQYAAFVATSPPPTGCAGGPTEPRPACTANIQGGIDPTEPVTCVDVCNARAYCDSVGKRLCGVVAGTSLPESDANHCPRLALDLNGAQWLAACNAEHPDGGEAPNNVEIGDTFPEWSDECAGRICMTYYQSQTGWPCAGTCQPAAYALAGARFRCCADLSRGSQ